MPKIVEGQCRLCQLTGRLVESHIIPKFHYRRMKEGGSSFHVLSNNPDKADRLEQREIKESLLCPQCDNVRLSRYEAHVSKILFDEVAPGDESDGILTFSGYDYKLLKNGLLSVLWRMSLSSNKFFSEVNLGKRHEEALRKVLLNDNELGEEEYPVVMVAPVFMGKAMGQAMIRPDFTRFNGNRVYRCLISGLIFTFFVGSSALDDTTKQLVLRRDRWPVPRVKTEEIPFLHGAILELAQAAKVREERAGESKKRAT